MEEGEMDDVGMRFSHELSEFIRDFVSRQPEDNAITMCTVVGSLQLQMFKIYENTVAQAQKMAQLHAAISK